MKEQITFIMYPDDLLSKWGFGDGDRLSDFLDDAGHAYEFKVNTHKLLEELVKRFLLPNIKKKVEIYFIDTIHNPVRAEMIDGVYYTNHYEDDDNGLLGSDPVELTAEQVVAVAKEMEGWNAAS